MSKTAAQTAEEVLATYLPDEYYEDVRKKLVPLVTEFASQESDRRLEEIKEKLKSKTPEIIKALDGIIGGAKDFSRRCDYLNDLIDSIH